jgi:hypothetical protein
MDRLGPMPALVALFFLSALGGHEFKGRDVLSLTAVRTLAG